MRTAAEALSLRRASSLAEALAIMSDGARAGRPVTPLAGGTDVFVALNAGVARERAYVDVFGLDELRGIRLDGDALVLGANTTYTDCIRSSLVGEHLPILCDAAKEVGGVQIQNRGTLAGNVGNGSPAADGVPVLMAADAGIVLQCSEGEREVPLASYYTGYRRSVRRDDELIVRIRIPLAATTGKQRFRKVGTRAAQAISKVAMAAILDGKRNAIAIGSVAPTVVRARHVEAYLDGGGRDAAEARRLILSDISPIDDVRSSASYRRRVTQNLVGWLLAGGA